MHTIAATKSHEVFESLLHGIVGGKYKPDSRLPAERELARQLGASRPTVRDAIRRLREWGMVEPRRGSGVRVRERREWSIEVLPAYLLHALGTPEEIGVLVYDLLSLRRGLFSSILPAVAGRLSGRELPQTRELVELAWVSRDDPVVFATVDFQMIRSLFEAAGMLPALWMLNRVEGVYVDIARSVSGTLPPPPDYRESHHSWLDALESGDSAEAVLRLNGYFDRHDRRLLDLLGIEK